MTVRTSTRLAAGTAALAAALFMTACTSSEQASDGHTDHSHESTEQEPVIAGEPAAFNDADVTFASMMVPHHEQAVELSALVPDRSTNPELTALAQQIQAAQEPEINTMNAFLVQWNQGADQHAGHDMSSMEGMVDAATMTRLESLQGAEFDTLWLQSMIAHHEGAIAMAKTELADGTNPDAKALAQHIIDGQQAEIDQMKTMLGGS
ncbi:DUF305 domain-containing protein [Mycolicibacterium tokaiense]|uniref:Putative lipoprotein n=1 Tax=Mycolicibacterium tokaiense TaxID=39695 RepID=A0A378THA6_9MYCO|nr:DUF305 domain-containing protein [Mycolicibacterium tokaiense]ANW66837.1 DUF305 domain-containing protein [Mycobacterium sp. djl-10]BBY85305.1 hypothetical protein MTOK_10870 [Mycolicibacterium tokaiense]STZ60188.1 putative lipoprotein [Mycolicibacterium tokaiense]